MNWEHLRAFVWLRWRLRANQNKRASAANVWIQRIILALGLTVLVAVFSFSVIAGLFLLPKASAPILMFVFDGMILVFLFMWMTELMIELQRSELLSMDKFLHLPVSLNGAFLINYLGSMLSPSICLFFAATLGVSIGLTIS